MNERTKTIGLIADMLQRMGAREVRFVYVLLSAMMEEGATV